MSTKILELKASTSAERGTFEGIANAYNVLDLVGDITLPGAFTASIAASGGRVKILNQHEPTDPIGIGMLEDRAEGLWIKGRLELGLESARHAWTRIKTGLIDGLSIGYSVKRERITRDARLLMEVDVHEVSLATFPANVASRITSVKARGNEQELHDLLSALQTTRIAIRNDRDRQDAAVLKELLVQFKFKKLDTLISQI